MNQGMFDAICQRLDRIIELLEKQPNQLPAAAQPERKSAVKQVRVKKAK